MNTKVNGNVNVGEASMIDIQAVSKVYPGGKRANDNISFTIEEGSIFGLLGPNGAGKSTLLKLMTGVLKLDHGDIFLNSHSIKTSPLEAKRQFAFVTDSPDNFLRLTGLEYLNFVSDVYQIDTALRQERIQRFSEQLGMQDALPNQINSYSHGMRQKMMVMGALVVNPPIWILDEPLIGLDPRSAYNLKQLMKEHVAQGNTVVFSTHVLEVAQSLVDKLAIINQGRLIFCGSLEQLREQQDSDQGLEEIFLEITDESYSKQLQEEQKIEQQLHNPFAE